MDTEQRTYWSCIDSDVTKDGSCHGCGHEHAWCKKYGKLSEQAEVAEDARNWATFAPPEPPKTDPETAKKLQAQQDDLSNQLQNLQKLISNEANLRAKIAEYEKSLEESEVREDKARNDAERSAEMARRITEEVAKAKAEFEAAQNAKEIADAKAKFRAEISAAQAAKREAEWVAAKAAANAAYEAQVKEDADAVVAAEKARVEAAATKVKAEAAKAKLAAEKAKPIKFKDALGRKFNFPYEMCKTWKGMNDLICQAFAHVETIGQMVADGNYDLIGPSAEIILPHIWETVVEPDWTVTMLMWPIKEVPTEKPPPPGMTMRHPGHPFSKKHGRASAELPPWRKRGDSPLLPPPSPPPSAPIIPRGPGWIGPLSSGRPQILANKPRKNQGTSGWLSIVSGTSKKATKVKKNENILHSSPRAPLQERLTLSHEEEGFETLGSSILPRENPICFHSPSEERLGLFTNSFALPQSAERSYPSVSEFRVTEYTKQQEAEAERRKQAGLQGAAPKSSYGSFIQTVTHSDAEKKQPHIEHGLKTERTVGAAGPTDTQSTPAVPDNYGDKDHPTAEQLKMATDVGSTIESASARRTPPGIGITGDGGQPKAEQQKQEELVEARVEVWDEAQTLLQPYPGNTDEEQPEQKADKPVHHMPDRVEPWFVPPTPPASDRDGDKQHLAVWATPPSTYVPFEFQLSLPSEIPLPLSCPATPARTSTPPLVLSPLNSARLQNPASPFGPRLLYGGRDGTRLYAPYQYEQVGPPQQERSPLSIVWAVVFCLSLGTISLVILTFGTTIALIAERTSATTTESTSADTISKSSTSDPEFSLILQSSLWAITNLIAGLIPACMHATRYRKWLRMNYAWLPAVVCLVMVVASVPIYLRSPALSNGLAGVANIPMGLFIFFASWEAMREEGREKCGCVGKGRLEVGSRSSEDSLSLRKDSGIELGSLGYQCDQRQEVRPHAD